MHSLVSHKKIFDPERQINFVGVDTNSVHSSKLAQVQPVPIIPTMFTSMFIVQLGYVVVHAKTGAGFMLFSF